MIAQFLRPILCLVHLVLLSMALFSCQSTQRAKTVVLTFDDAVKSHRTFVTPLLKEYGFGATFFVTHRWMEDSVNFMSWQEIAEIHEMGFEIGNHSWSHIDFAAPKSAARMEGELGLVNLFLERNGVPKPVSFAWCGNGFGPEALDRLEAMGYKFARRGMQPEVAYGQVEPGPLYEPEKHHPLLIPSAGDAYPQWTLDHFKKVVDRAEEGKIVVLQFHGVPDEAHPWVNTSTDLFKRCMKYLANNDFQVIAMKDLEKYQTESVPDDPLITQRYSSNKNLDLDQPVEVQATRDNLSFWLANMLQDHQYSEAETSIVSGINQLNWPAGDLEYRLVRERNSIKVLPFPGGRHPRIGFLDGALDPLRGTKLSIFLPWDTTQYILVDLPEAIFSQKGLEFLAHTHVPTIYDFQHQTVENRDWQWESDGWINEWEMPNKLKFGAKATPTRDAVDLELWLENGTTDDLDSLRTQVCIMFSGAKDFNDLTNTNKTYGEDVIATRSKDEKYWVLTWWENPNRVWGNEDVPCMHVDPRFAACKVGERVTLKGRIWFSQEESVRQEMQRAGLDLK